MSEGLKSIYFPFDLQNQVWGDIKKELKRIAASASYVLLNNYFSHRFCGTLSQHRFSNCFKLLGQLVGIGREMESVPTPHIMAWVSRPLYGTSAKSNSHKTTPNDHTSTFSEHGSWRITSGAIQATVPVKVITALTSFHFRLVPKSLTLAFKLWLMSMLKYWKWINNWILKSNLLNKIYSHKNSKMNRQLTWGSWDLDEWFCLHVNIACRDKFP